MTSICFFPVVRDESQLTDLLSRAAWFLSFAAADRIDLPVATAELAAMPWRVAPGMDPALEGNFAPLRQKLRLVVATTVDDLEPPMRAASVILRWQKDARPDFVPGPMLASWEKGKRVFQVDPVAIRQEGSFYIEAGLHLVREKEALVAECQRKFSKLAERLGRFERTFVMATGPSVASYRRFDYAGSLGIVCNSVILDEDLLQTVRPRILVFADPIFHFGPSQYAGAFRAKMREAVERHDLAICIPFKYYPLFIAAMPELRDRTIAVPFAKDRGFNFDLRAEFTVRTTANILTFLMLPLAATFADEINVLGCDGRPLAENTYFWGHNPSTQINDKMANIREVHPGFFAIDYNDYYLEHCETLEALFRAGEAARRRFVSIGFSHIPALRSRTGRGPRFGDVGIDAGAIKAVIVADPDGLGWSGHYMAYNDKLAAAFQALGCSVRVLCHRKIDPSILAERKNFLPMLDTHSWSVGQSKSPDYVIRVLTDEIDAALRRVELDAPATALYLYTGSLEHARALANVTRRWPSIFVHVNLFYLPFRDTKDAAWIERWRPFVQWLDIAGPRFVATVPTREAQADVLDAFGVLLDVAPHPSTGVGDERLAALPPPKAPQDELRVIFPGGPRLEKGYLDTVACVRLLGEQPGLRTLLRHAPTASTPDALREAPLELPANCEIVSGALDNDAFERFFRSGDIVVLPYTPDAFAKRTSGLLIDSLYYGLPAVVVEGTWLAALVRRYGCGVVVPDALPASLRDGVLQVAADITGFRQRVHEAAHHYFVQNTWRALAGFVLRPLDARVAAPRLLCIDLTGLDGISATGRVKEALFLGWPRERFLLASLNSPSGQMRLSTLDGSEALAPSDDATVMHAIRAFAPEVVYYRAVDNDIVHSFAKHAIAALGVPHVVHLMDDWPERLRRKSPDKAALYDADLRTMLAGSRAALAIGEPMAHAFAARYGREFDVVANAVDPAAFPPRPQRQRADGSLRIAYTGALADDMTFQSVKDLAAVLPTLDGAPVLLDVYTREPWLARATQAFEGNAAVTVRRQVPAADYHALLQQADVLLVAYNFDEATQAYVGLSRANKMPEYLASGTPLLAYGPKSIATIAELQACGGALVVTERSPAALAQAINVLRGPLAVRQELSDRARAAAFDTSDAWKVARLLRWVIAADPRAKAAPGRVNPQPIATVDTPVPTLATGSPLANARVLVGPHPRSAAAHWDETLAIARLFRGPLHGSTMIDVGAHHGSALAPFLRRGWKVIAFEPDEKNRAALLENLEHLRAAGVPVDTLIEIDTRAVSNESCQGLPFYRSPDSTGISGLSAFHASHEQKQTVDTVTLAEALTPRGLTGVDFLKIDTEGFDLRVLQGFPWERLRPRVVECEFEDSKTIPLGYRYDDLAAFLAERGYTIYVSEWHPIERYGVRHDWHRLASYPCTLANPASWGNLIGFRDPIDADQLVDAVFGELRLGDMPAARPARQQPSPPQSLLPAGVDWPDRPTRVAADTAFRTGNADSWHVEPAAPKGKMASWFAVFDAPADLTGRMVSGSLTLRSNRAVELRVALCRDGHSAYEGARRPIRLAAGVPQTVGLVHCFRDRHAAVRLQVDVVAAPHGFDLQVLRPRLHGDLTALCAHVPAAKQTLAVANRLFREGDYATAMAIYDALAKRIPLRMYADNARLCGRRLGLDDTPAQPLRAA